VFSDTPDPIGPGQDLTYDVTVTNVGAATAQDVEVTIPVPGGTTFVSAARVAGPSSSITTPAVDEGGAVTTSTTSLAPGEAVSFRVVVRVSASAANNSEIGNTASASTSSPESLTSNNVAAVSTRVSAGAAPTARGVDLVVSPSPRRARARRGRTARLRFRVANRGSVNATRVRFRNRLPRGLRLVRARSGRGRCARRGSTVTCSLGTLRPGASIAITLTVRATRRGTLRNRVSATSAQPDLRRANNAATVTIRVR
jgi:uncharacterized repeat protein (TIGR01451 family)